ncbi:MAG: zinc ribbon domain-containing protein [Clostridiales bacterium]|nr:zinc ribbon domain-containing protein [Clostridiales bacterium]
MYSCPGCGSQMLFDIAGQQLKCGRCDRTMSIEEADEKEARQAGSSFAVDVLTCPTCGAEIRAVNTAAASFCSYCGSSVMLEKQEGEEFVPPETVIPFQITREQCFEKFRSMLKGSFCADHRLKKNITADSFRGIYVPYHTYAGSVEGSTTVEGSETKGDTTYYYKTQIDLDHHYIGIMHDASREMPDNISEAISISKDARDLVRPFSPAYLSGFYADVSDTDPEYYIPYARSETIRKGLEDTLPALKDDSCSYSTAAAEKALMPKAQAEYTGDTMIPVWFMSMKSGKRVLYAVQNAVTGEMWADIPMDISRFALVTLAIAAVLFFVFNSFLTLRPEMVMLPAMLLAIFAQIAVNGRRTKMQEKEMAEAVVRGETVDVSDRMTKMKRLEKRVSRQKNHGIFRYLGALGAGAGSVLALNILSSIDNIKYFRYGALILTVVMAMLIIPWEKKAKLPVGCIVTFIAMVAGTLIMLLDPFHSANTPVYIVTLVIVAGVVWECLSLLKLYNKSCSNALPQFESHTGGELL